MSVLLHITVGYKGGQQTLKLLDQFWNWWPFWNQLRIRL